MPSRWPDQSTPERQIETLQEVILFAIKHNVPVHCGEFGVSMISPGEDHLVWLDDYLALLERFGIGWNWWNWSGSDIYRTGLKAGDEVSPNLPVLRKWIERKKVWRSELKSAMSGRAKARQRETRVGLPLGSRAVRRTDEASPPVDR